MKAKETKLCKNKNCQKPLPEDYKHKYCEACRNKRFDKIKDGTKVALSLVALFVGGSGLITKGISENID